MAARVSKETVYLSLLTALAIIIHGFEYMIPAVTPWFKFGLANSVSLAVISVFGMKQALIVSILRIFISSLFFGTFLSPIFILSFTGGVAGTIAMGVAYKVFFPFFSMIGISLIGAYVHVLAQGGIIFVLIIQHQNIFLLLPAMLLLSLVTGVVNGNIAIKLSDHLKNANFSKSEKKLK